MKMAIAIAAAVTLFLIPALGGLMKALALRDSMSSDLVAALVVAGMQLITIIVAGLAAALAWRGVQNQVKVQAILANNQRAGQERFVFYQWKINAERMLHDLLEATNFTKYQIDSALSSDPIVYESASRTRQELGRRVEEIWRDAVYMSSQGRLRYSEYDAHLDSDVVGRLTYNIGRVKTAWEMLNHFEPVNPPDAKDYDVQMLGEACKALESAILDRPHQKHEQQVASCEHEIAVGMSELRRLLNIESQQSIEVRDKASSDIG